MPAQKDLKRLVRSRMQKTGESYTAARLQLVKKSDADKLPPARDLAALAGMSDEAVKTKTGRSWAEWVRHLDATGAAEKPHREIAAYLKKDLGVPSWWSQMVTVGYERIKGLREKGQTCTGAYEATKSKSFPVPVERLYRAFSTPRGRGTWLKGIDLKVRKTTPEKTMYVTWPDGTSVAVRFLAKGDSRSQVAVEHSKLASREEASRLKQFWTERLSVLEKLLVAN